MTVVIGVNCSILYLNTSQFDFWDIFTKDHVSVLNYFRVVDICKIEMFDNNCDHEIYTRLCYNREWSVLNAATAHQTLESFKIKFVPILQLHNQRQMYNICSLSGPGPGLSE